MAKLLLEGDNTMLQIPEFPNEKPTINSNSSDWADYVEYLAFFRKTYAIVDCLRPIFKSSDELVALGIDNEEDKQNNLIDDIAEEIKRRQIESKGTYPFELIDEDYVVSHKEDVWNSVIYKFLHYTTYLNMGTNRSHGGHDGAKLFEEFSAIIAKNYLGEFTSGGVFGTALAGGFKEKLQKVMTEMGEGTGVKSPLGASPQDEDIDLIVWKPFHDRRKSMLIAFGQCKTGLSWQKSYVRLPISTITDNWFLDKPIVGPIPLFFCSMNFPIHRWDYQASKIGIVFDRLRILGLYSQLDIERNTQLFDRIKKWVEAVELWLIGPKRTIA